MIKKRRTDCIISFCSVSATRYFEILLNSNADLDIQNVNGNTPLWEAVMRYRGDGFFIEQLLKMGLIPI